jgi:hypothetical protein
MDSRPLKKVRGLKVIWVSKLASIRSSTSSLFFLSLIYQSFIGLKGASWTTRSLLELELLVAPLNPPLCCRHNVHLYIFFSMLYRWILVQHQEICVIACRVMIEYRARILIVWSYLASKSIKNKFNLWPKINIWGRRKPRQYYTYFSYSFFFANTTSRVFLLRRRPKEQHTQHSYGRTHSAGYRGHVHPAYNPSFSACFFSRNSIFLSQ